MLKHQYTRWWRYSNEDFSLYTRHIGSGGLVAFGKNDHGQLGIDGMSGPVFEPTRLTGVLENAVVTKLACGYYHTVAVTEDGAVYTFGRNDYGQLGLGHSKHVAKPTVRKMYVSACLFV